MVGNMITALEAAEKIHCSKEYIHYLRKEGKIKGYRVGSRYFFSLFEINEYASSHLKTETGSRFVRSERAAGVNP